MGARRVILQLTPGEVKVLTRLAADFDPESDYDETELIQSTPGGWYIGADRVSGVVGMSLLRMCLISKDQDSDEEDKVVRYHINEWGRKALSGEEILVPAELLLFMRIEEIKK